MRLGPAGRFSASAPSRQNAPRGAPSRSFIRTTPGLRKSQPAAQPAAHTAARGAVREAAREAAHWIGSELEVRQTARGVVHRRLG
jgi:hypothetical protein